MPERPTYVPPEVLIAQHIPDANVLEQVMVSLSVLRQSLNKLLPSDLVEYHESVLKGLGFTTPYGLLEHPKEVWVKALDILQRKQHG